MARQPLQVALDPKLVAAMDEARGDVPRSLWVARAVERSLAEHSDLERRLDRLERTVEKLTKGRK